MNINDLNEEKRLAALASLKEGIDDAYALGAAALRSSAGNMRKRPRKSLTRRF
jgi:hypothetical protein